MFAAVVNGLISILVFIAISVLIRGSAFSFMYVFLKSLFVVYMSSLCLADVQDFWILIWIVLFTICIMITACLEVSNSHLQLLDVIV